MTNREKVLARYPHARSQFIKDKRLWKIKDGVGYFVGTLGEGHSEDAAWASAAKGIEQEQSQ